MLSNLNVRRSLFSICSALTFSAILVIPVVAQDDTVDQEIIGGGQLTAFVANADMAQVAYSNDEGVTLGELILEVDDPRGTSVGWTVSIQSTDFVWGGTGNASALDIPAEGFNITGVGTPAMTAGQAVGLGGPRAETGAIASLAMPLTPISASPGFGSGTYTQSLPVSLVIPARSQIGTYTAVLTVLTSVAP